MDEYSDDIIVFMINAFCPLHWPVMSSWIYYYYVLQTVDVLGFSNSLCVWNFKL